MESMLLYRGASHTVLSAGDVDEFQNYHATSCPWVGVVSSKTVIPG